MHDEVKHAGATIRALRNTKRYTQPELARAVNVSVSMLSKVECGDRAATHSLLMSVARVLQVPLERLTGQPYSDTTHDADTHSAIDALRGALRRSELSGDGSCRGLGEVATDVDVLARLRRDADYRTLARQLPGVLDELTVARNTVASDQLARVYGLLVTTYYAAHGLLYRLGFADLAETVEHKLSEAAARTGDPLSGGLARWARAQSFQAAGDHVHGLELMHTALGELEGELRSPTPAAVVLAGSLHLRSVTLASRAGDPSVTSDHLVAAYDLADRLGTGDQVHYGLTFGRANTTSHDTAAHVELGDSSAALAAAAAWSPPRTMPRTRRGHHHIDLARAHLMHGDRNGCLTALQEARRIAPQQTRLHPMVRETTAILVSQHRRSHPDLSNYASWLGLFS